jgi:uncharacterized protein involved in exopolysaccharide biosynthesis
MENNFITREINLIPIMIGILRRWYWIVVAAVIAGLIAGGLALRNPQRYEATATVILVGYRTHFALEPRLETRESTLSNYSSRRQALLQLATSTAIEGALPPETIETVAPDDYKLGQLTGSIEAQQEGDLLKITAHSLSPENAPILANAWAKTYVLYINQLLEDTDESVIALTLKQVEEARTTYEEAKQAYADFLRSNKLGEVEDQVDALDKFFEGNQDSALYSYQFQVERAQSLSLVLEDASALREQLSTGEVVAASEAVAALLLRIRSVGLQVSNEEVKTLPLASLDIQIDESNTSSLSTSLEQEAIVADLDRLIASVQEQLAALNLKINQTANSLANNEPSWPTGWSLKEQEEQYNRFEELRAQYEELLGEEEALVQSRDVALEKLQVVERKLAEQEIQANQLAKEVRLASEALLPGTPVSRGVILRFIIGATTGAIFGLLVAVVAVVSQLIRANKSEVGKESS